MPRTSAYLLLGPRRVGSFLVFPLLRICLRVYGKIPTGPNETPFPAPSSINTPETVEAQTNRKALPEGQPSSASPEARSSSSALLGAHLLLRASGLLVLGPGCEAHLMGWRAGPSPKRLERLFYRAVWAGLKENKE